jgi:hypothetical protein
MAKNKTNKSSPLLLQKEQQEEEIIFLYQKEKELHLSRS